MPTNDNLELIGQQIDRIDNLVAGLEMRLPEGMHIDQLKAILPEISAELKKSFIAETGENPWEFH